MNKQTLIILGGGLVAALVVALIMQALVGTPEQIAPATVVEQQGVPQSEILVATRSIEMGSVLAPADMDWQAWPTDAVFEGAVTRDSLENPNAEMPLEGRLRRRVAQGEPLVMSALVQDSEVNFIAATLSDGMRAVAISVDAQTSVGGFVKPGDMVDVILTYNVSIPTDPELAEATNSIVNRQASQTILENIKVMAVDQSATDSQEISVGRTVTLEVTPDQVEKVSLASSMGDLSLALRKIGDDATRLTLETQPQSVTDLRISNVIQEILNGDPDQFQNGADRTIKIYNGNQVQTFTIEPYTGQR